MAIPTLDRREALGRTLDRILACRPPPDEVLVHVDAGDEHTTRWLEERFPGVKAHQSAEAVGPGGGRTALLALARNDLVATFDDDSWPIDASYFGALLDAAAAHGDAAVIAARIREGGSELGPPIDRPTDVFTFVNCGCAFRRSALSRTGGFVPLPLAYGMDESDLALRLHAAGYRMIADPALRVCHDTELAHHARPEITAASIRNLALLAFLRYPVSLWWLGCAQVANRLLWLVRNGRRSGVTTGLLTIPGHLWHHRRLRAPVPARAVRSWWRGRRNEGANAAAA